MIDFENVCKRYGKSGQLAVDSLNLHIPDGIVFGFIGPNGAGKSTTINMMTGILAPTSGKITVGGFDIGKNPVEAKRIIGFVPDNQEIYDRLTGMEYLNFIADVFAIGKGDRQDVCSKLAVRYGMEQSLSQQIRTYSRGMKQKLAIIAALLHSPRLLVLDEPMVGLDPKASHLLKEDMRVHAEGGGTVFFSTHVLEVAEKLCDEIAIIDHGKVVAQGTMDELRGQEKGESLEQLFLQLTENGEENE